MPDPAIASRHPAIASRAAVRSATDTAGAAPAVPRPMGACACGGSCPRCSGDAAAERDADTRAAQLTGAAVPARRLSDGALDASTRAYFESRLGADLSGVRLHTGASAARAAQGLGARAYTVGEDIGFAAGAWDPGSRAGQALLAHELVHVAQQRGRPDGLVHLKKDGEPTAEEVAQDPSLLLCFILCEIGVPPAIWRTVTGLMLKAVWEEYRETYGELQGQTKFRAYQLAFKAYSPIRAIKHVLTFIVQGKISFVPIRTAGATALRKQMEAMLIKRGATAAGIIAAEQIARKVVIVIEAAIAAGCLTYCSLASAIKKVEELTVEFAEGLVAGVQALETAGEIIGGLGAAFADAVLVRPMLTAMASLDSFNWKLGELPSTLAKQDMLVLGQYWSSQLKGKEGDALISALSKPVSSHPAAAEVLRSVVREISAEREALDLDPLPATEDEFVEAKPFQVVAILVEYGHLDYVVDPSDIVDEMYADTDEEDDLD